MRWRGGATGNTHDGEQHRVHRPYQQHSSVNNIVISSCFTCDFAHTYITRKFATHSTYKQVVSMTGRSGCWREKMPMARARFTGLLQIFEPKIKKGFVKCQVCLAKSIYNQSVRSVNLKLRSKKYLQYTSNLSQVLSKCSRRCVAYT